ncbi:hypothetical protein SCUP234_07575 [Seiridium cupressi]
MLRKMSKFYNIAAENPQPWQILGEIIRESYNSLENNPFHNSIKRLRDISDLNAEEVANVPTIKMLEFYETLRSGTEVMKCTINHAK